MNEKSVFASIKGFFERIGKRNLVIAGAVTLVIAAVAVMLDGGFSYVYATDKKTTSSGESSSYVTVGSGDRESLVYLTEKAPDIVGVGVVCTGGMDPTVRREVTSLLSAVFGIGSNKIYVTGRG